MVDLRPTRLLSGVHVFSIFAEVGKRTTKTGRRGRRSLRWWFVLVSELPLRVVHLASHMWLVRVI